MRAKLFVALLWFLVLAAACDQVAQQPIPFPKRAYLGETVSLAVDGDTQYVLGARNFTLSSENLRIQLYDPVTFATYDVTPRAVVTGTTPLGTIAAEEDGATEISIAIFDLPTSLPDFTAPPSNIELYPMLYPSLEYLAGVYPTLEILGSAAQGDGPTVFLPSPPIWPAPTIERKLEPLPALRLRAKRPQFQHTWTIGSIEFEVVYPTAVSNPRAYTKINAARALAYATSISTGRARVVVVDPKGFKLPITSDTTVLGAGPFVDVAFDQSAPFSTGNFDIENLLVTDLNGNVLIDDPGNSEEYFVLYARANQ